MPQGELLIVVSCAARTVHAERHTCSIAAAAAAAGGITCWHHLQSKNTVQIVQNAFELDHQLCFTCCVCLQIGESGWAPPLPLESCDNSSQPDDMNTKPVLLCAQIPEWGTVHELVARVEMAGTGFERTMVSDCSGDLA